MFRSGQSEGTDFLAKQTLLQVCHLVIAVPVEGTTIADGQDCESALVNKEWSCGRHQGVWGCSEVAKEMILIFQPNILCYKYAIVCLCWVLQ